MSELIAFTQISPPVRMRNEHWQRRFSENFALIEKLLEFAVEPDGVESLVNEVCEAVEVPMPEFAFNSRRNSGFARFSSGLGAELSIGLTCSTRD